MFEEEHDLTGTPDPDVTSITDGVLGTRVELHFDGHENRDCGGFSELLVLGTVR